MHKACEDLYLLPQLGIDPRRNHLAVHNPVTNGFPDCYLLVIQKALSAHTAEHPMRAIASTLDIAQEAQCTTSQPLVAMPL